MRCILLSFPLTLSPLCFLVVRLALILQTTKTLTYRSGSDSGLFIRSIVETGGSLLFEGNVCVVLCEKRSEIHEARGRGRLCIRPSPFSWFYVACCGRLAYLGCKKNRNRVHDTSCLEFSLLLQDCQSSCFLQLTFSSLPFRLLALSVGKTGTSFG